MIKRPELRKDYIQDKYVIIAPQRNKRPHDVEVPVCTVPQKKNQSPFSADNLRKEKALLTIGPEKSWRVKVLLNKYPAISINNPKAYGQQEVVVETPDPRPETDDLPVSHIEDILRAYATRTKELAKNKKIEYILIFKNNGGSAGASLRHSHSQIFATNFIPPHIFDKSQKQQEYKIRTGHCVYCDVIKKESKSPRLVYKNKHIIAFTPYASMYNYEIWLMPLAHQDNITELTDQEMESLAKTLKHILKKIKQLGLPYNYYFHQVINDNDQHLYLKIVPRGSLWAGVEIGSGIIINPIDPDQAAAYYRQGL